MKHHNETLHIFIGNGGDDYVIAADEADANAIVLDLVGPERMYDIEWRQWPDDAVWAMTDIDEPGQPTEEHLPAAWVAQYGRCWLGGNP